MFRILVSDPLGQEGIAILEEAGDAEVHLEPGISAEELVARIGDFDALIVRSETQVTRDVIDAGTELKVVGRAGVGVDNVDVDAATRRGIAVANTPDASTNAAVEQTIALMLAAARKTAHAHASMLEGEWSRDRFVGTEMRGKTLGIIGLGRIGRKVAAVARALGMEVVAHDPYISEEVAREHDVALMEMPEVLKSSDVLTLHLPAADGGGPLIDAAAIAQMKRNAIIVNAARGWLIDSTALASALDEGRLRAAGIDVYETEPPPADHPLIGHPKVVHTPHLGASTEEAQADVATDIADQVLRILRGDPQ